MKDELAVDADLSLRRMESSFLKELDFEFLAPLLP